VTEPLLSAADLAASDADQAVSFASGLAREFCGWHIAPPRTETRQLSGDGTNVLLLPSLRVTDVARVSTVDEGDLTDVAWSENGVLTRTTATELAWITTPGNLLLRQHVFPDGLGNVTVEFTHGYDETPDAIRAVVAAVARRLLGNGSGVPVMQEGAGGLLRVYGMARNASPAFTAVEAMVLDRYRLPKGA